VEETELVSTEVPVVVARERAVTESVTEVETSQEEVTREVEVESVETRTSEELVTKTEKSTEPTEVTESTTTQKTICTGSPISFTLLVLCLPFLVYLFLKPLLNCLENCCCPRSSEDAEPLVMHANPAFGLDLEASQARAAARAQAKIDEEQSKVDLEERYQQHLKELAEAPQTHTVEWGKPGMATEMTIVLGDDVKLVWDDVFSVHMVTPNPDARIEWETCDTSFVQLIHPTTAPGSVGNEVLLPFELPSPRNRGIINSRRDIINGPMNPWVTNRYNDFNGRVDIDGGAVIGPVMGPVIPGPVMGPVFDFVPQLPYTAYYMSTDANDCEVGRVKLAITVISREEAARQAQIDEERWHPRNSQSWRQVLVDYQVQHAKESLEPALGTRAQSDRYREWNAQRREVSKFIYDIGQEQRFQYLEDLSTNQAEQYAEWQAALPNDNEIKLDEYQNDWA